jgi:hypothetical protein
MLLPNVLLIIVVNAEAASYAFFMLASSFGEICFASFFCFLAFCSDSIKAVFTINASSWFDCPSCLFAIVSSPLRLLFSVLPSMLSLAAVKIFVMILKVVHFFPSITLSQCCAVSGSLL